MKNKKSSFQHIMAYMLTLVMLLSTAAQAGINVLADGITIESSGIELVGGEQGSLWVNVPSTGGTVELETPTDTYTIRVDEEGNCNHY